MGSKLWQCSTFEEQTKWCRKMLESGRILSDPEIFLGGGDTDRIIRKLRKEGMKLVTTRKETTDASGVKHKSLAWVLQNQFDKH